MSHPVDKRPAGEAPPGGAVPVAEKEELQRVLREELLRQKIALGLEDDEIDLGELFRTVLRHWKLWIVLPLIVAALTAGYTLTLKNQYKAQTTLFVHAKGQGAAGGLAALLGGSLGGMLSMGAPGGSGADYLLSLLKSDTMTERMIRDFNLATHPAIVGEKPSPDMRRDDLLKAFGTGIANITKDAKTGLINIAVETTDATLSATLANGYAEVLNTVTKGPEKEKRRFIEKQLTKVSGELAAAEMALKAFQDEHKLVVLDEQTRLLVQKMAELESDRTRGEMTVAMQDSMLQSLGRMANLVKVESERISELARQQVLRAAIASLSAKLANLPELALQYTRLTRELAVKQKLFGILTEQLEMAKISESEESSQFEIIDRAVPPQRKSKPARAVTVVMATVVAGMFGVFAAFALEFWRRQKAKPAMVSPSTV